MTISSVIHQTAAIEASPTINDMIAFTVPISDKYAERVNSRVEKCLSSGSYHIRPWAADISPYRKTCSVTVNGKSIARISIMPNFDNAAPFRVEYNPHRMAETDDVELVATLRYLLGNKYGLIWNSANITRFDATIDLYNCFPDQVVIFQDNLGLTRYTLDGNSGILNHHYGKSKSHKHLSVYKKIPLSRTATRLEFRLRIHKLPAFTKDPIVGLVDANKIMRYNPFIGLKIYSAQFMCDSRFDPGFYDCIRVRGLLGALARYAEYNKQLETKYVEIVQRDYAMNVFDPVDVWAGMRDRLNDLHIFNPNY
jgi:hypothetical protein